ncbi:amino acid adenylation domain-containing protein [Micromonospora haikouensis]|uniref:Phenyloxazoline synthase MbtB n=1 Tax=Micromonospora haikouensis TaxID=686309 RepID=A0A1C4XHF0_9ACTN|nr:non-ribosomal peptide synthetase [Micromonospora haikouensis]SCF07752.1 amino acid adenylation domain-containing protein [Micromonospora haikouensis]
MADVFTGDALPPDLARRIEALTPQQRRDFEAVVRRRLSAGPTTATAATSGSWPASPGQERMWIGDDAGENAYATVIRLRGPLCLPALRASLLRLTRRHGALRTTLHLVDSRLMQVVSTAARVPLRLVDLTAAGGAKPVHDDDLPALVVGLARVEARRPFDSDLGPLWRAVVYALGPADHCLLLVLHHAITDGWSHGILVSELSACYASLTAGTPWRVRPPVAGYPDYTRWQRERIEGAELVALTDFWRAVVRDLPRLDLPLAPRPDPAVSARRGPPSAGVGTSTSGHRGGHLTVAIGRELSGRLNELRQATGGSPFMLVLAALVAVLRLVSGQDDIVVGTLAAGRTRPEWERVVGYFVNVLPLRFTVAGQPSFRELWAHVRRRVQDAYAHQELPYERVRELLRTERSAGPTGPIRVLCTPQLPAPRLDLPGLAARTHDLRLGNTPFDLVIEVGTGPDGLQVAFQFDRALLGADSVALLGRHLRTVLARIVGAPDVACADLLPGAPDGDRPETIAGSVHGLVEDQAARTPDAVAVRDGDRHLTYRALNAAANRAARRLRSAGVLAEHVVAVCLPRSAESVTARLAVLKAGAAFVALDPDHPPARLSATVAAAGARTAVTTTALAAVLPGDLRPVPLDLDPGGITARDHRNLYLPVHPDQAAYLIHTSGSTGRPKLVVGHHRGMVNRLRWMQRAYPVRGAQRCAARTPLSFVDSIAETFGPLAAGATLVVAADALVTAPDRFTAWLVAERVDRLLVVPALLAMLLDLPPALRGRLTRVGTWLTSGEELRVGLAERFLRALPGTALLNLYGSSEVAADATAAEVAAPVGDVAPIGRPVDGVTAWVGDAAGRPVDDLVRGVLRVGGHAVARGYHGQPGDTAARFRPDRCGPPGTRVFLTGDVVRRRADRELVYLGRADAQVQIRGHRVEPGEVEEELLRHPAVRSAVVIAAPDVVGAPTLVAYLVAAADGAVDPAEIVGYLRGRLPSYLVPSRLVVVDELPRTDTGKVDRMAVAAADGDPARWETVRPDPDRGEDAPRGPDETVVAATFREVLGVAAVGRDEDFFLAGGHSVLATQLVRLLSERMSVSLQLADVFAAPTVAALAARVAGLERSGPAAVPLVPDPARRHEPFPLTEVQEAYYVGRREDLRLGGVSTHAYLEFDVDDFDPERFLAALRTVVRRHPMLRAVLRPDGTQQVLADVPPYPMTIHDLRGLDADERERRLRAVRRQMSHQLLDPHTWPLFEVRACLLDGRAAAGGPPRGLLAVSVDALVCDAFSFGLVMDELAQRYHQPDREFPELTVDFRDWVLHRAARHGDAGHREAREYWSARIPTLPPGPDLPAAPTTGPDLPNGQPAGPHRPQFRRRDGRLAEATWSALKRRAATCGLTPSGVLLAAFAETLTRWSTRPHYCLMLTVFDRAPLHPQLADIVGDFTSLTLLEVDHRTPAPFEERARALQDRLWSDLDRSEVSAVTVLREWTLAQGGAPRPVTPVVFTSNLPMAVAATAPTRRDTLGKLRYGITQTPQVQLDHQVSEVAGELLFNWDAVEEQFAPGVLDDMFAAYQEMLVRLAERPEEWSRPIRCSLPPYQAVVRARANDTARPLPARRLHDRVVTAAGRHPTAVAVVDGDVRMTYAELDRRARRVAHALQALDVRPDMLVAVATGTGWQQVVAALGILYSGAAFLPLDPRLPSRRFESLARRAQVRVLLTQTSLRRDLPPVPGTRVVAVDDDTALSDGPGPVSCPSSPRDLAYVIFTSGSTGEPKGVAIDHGSAANTVDCVNERFGVGPADRVLAVSSLSFDLAVYDLFGPLAVGGCVVLPDRAGRRDPGHWLHLVREERVTLWNSVPALACLLVDRAEAGDPRALEPLRVVLLSGDWIPVPLPDRIRALTDARVISLGGATEGSIWSVWYPIGRVDPRWRSIPYGRPMANQRMYVLDAALDDRPDRVPGDLYIGGAGVARGYWNDPDLTARAFVAHPRTGERLYRTGDLARYLPDGELEFLGRADRQVKVNGFRVELGEVETAIERTGMVGAVVVLALGSSDHGRRLAAFVVPAAGRAPDLDVLRRRVAEVLPDYLRPTTWTVGDRIPLTGNGKVDHEALEQLVRSPVTSDVGRSEAGAPEELVRQLRDLWQEILPVEHVGPHDNFFALGGTSIVAVRLLDLLRRRCRVQVSLPDLFDAPTVTALAAAVAARRAAATPPVEVVTVEPDPASAFEPFPLTDIQQAYWLGRRVGSALGGVATHSYLEFDVVDLDVARLAAAVRGLVDRHPALRTVVRADGRQQVLPAVPPYQIPVTDLSALPPEQARQELDGLRERLSHEVRDVSRWPLFALYAVRLDATVTRLYLSIDLMMVDARSIQLLTGELQARYTDSAFDPPALGLTFRDYAAAARRRRQETNDAALRYWRRRLPDLPPPPALPLLRRPEELTAVAFTRRTVELDRPTWQRLRERAAQAAVTPSALLCTAFGQVLAGWSERPRFTVNLTTFDRLPLHPEVDALVGDFTTTTLLAMDHSGGSFWDIAPRIQRQIFTDLEHRAVSGVEVLRMLRRDPAGGGETMMPVVFTSALLPGGDEPAVAGWTARPVYALSQTPQVLLDHQVTEHSGGLVCTWDYAADAFPPGLVETMIDAFHRLLRSLAGPAAGADTSHPSATVEVSADD